MKTPVLDALSILHSWAESNAGSLDNQLCNWDDGESHSVKEAKDVMQSRLNNMIRELTEMRTEVQTMSWEKFKEKHL